MILLNVDFTISVLRDRQLETSDACSGIHCNKALMNINFLYKMARVVWTSFIGLFVCLSMCIPAGVSGFGVVSESIFNTSDVLGNIQIYCPLHQSCNGDNHNDRNESSVLFDGCCLHCYCDDACLVTGNCCPGKVRRESWYSVKQCIQTFHLSPMHKYEQFHNSSYVLNLVGTTSQCEKEIIDKCLFGKSSVLSENTPVYVKSIRVNYRNVFCAKCDGNNDDDDIVSWPARISCESYNSDLLRLLLKRDGENDIQLFERLQKDRCSLFWDPVQPEETERCIHDDDMISTCPGDPSTGFEADQCISDDPALRVPIFQTNQLFKNIYCAECNYELMPKYTITAGNCSAPIFVQRRSNFVTLLDVNAYSLQSSEGECLDFNVVSY